MAKKKTIKKAPTGTRKKPSKPSARPTFQAVREPFMRWLSLPNSDVVEIVAATILANRLPGSPLWLALVGPSSSGKTEVVRACEGLKWTHSIGHFTRGTFMSGWKASEKDKRTYGLLQEMNDGKPHMVLINDFSSVLNKKWDDRMEIMNQFRYLYDGSWDASYGNKVCIRWRGKCGMIVCSTGVYDSTLGAQTAFGDRFLVCRPMPGDPESIAEKAIRNAMETDRMRSELNAAMKLIDRLKVPAKEAPLSLDAREFISKLTMFVCRARSYVPRDTRTHELNGTPEIEGSGRTASQLGQLLRGLLVLRERKVPTLDEMEIIERVALGTIPSLRLRVMRSIEPGGSRGDYLRQATQIPSSVMYRTLEDLRQLKLMTKERISGTKASRHSAAPGFEPFFFRCRQKGF